MKGFGIFVITVLLLSSVLLLHASKIRAAGVSACEISRGSQSIEKIGFIRNALRKSHEKIVGSDSAWRMEVQELAGYYSVEIVIDGQKVIVIDNANSAMGELHIS